MNSKHIIKSANPIITLGLGIIIGAAVGYFLLQPDPYQAMITRSLDHSRSGTDIVSAGSVTIGKDFLNERVKHYIVHVDPAAARDPYLEDRMLKKTIDDLIVLEEMRSSGYLKSDRVQQAVAPFIEEALIRDYLDTRITLRGSGSLTDSEIEDFYTKNESFFSGRSIAKKEALELIRTTLDTRSPLTESRRAILRRIEMGKIKSKYKVHINESFHRID